MYNKLVLLVTSNYIQQAADTGLKFEINLQLGSVTSGSVNINGIPEYSFTVKKLGTMTFLQ